MKDIQQPQIDAWKKFWSEINNVEAAELGNIQSDILYYLSALEEAYREIAEKDKEIERLRAALIVERDDALTWDGVGTVNRINAVLSPN